MQKDSQKVSTGGIVVFALLLLNAVILEQGYVSSAKWYQLAWVTVPLLLFFILQARRKPL
ncbi:MAG TPA: hypothetical protein VMR70_14500 [Flavisolibacter sp.]|nr:hypothetical protein [Flavisolibacter sp.]